jgi:hypothetical protein
MTFNSLLTFFILHLFNSILYSTLYILYSTLYTLHSLLYNLQGAVLGPDGCLYAMPANARTVLKINPYTLEVKEIGALPKQKDKFQVRSTYCIMVV